ncbi:MAG: CHASE2 domain-containing protein [Gammaproteobacteria bacterium]|nr:CHASE2 domain-containing protein [Gammaproteobacteria bacterium]
MRLASKILYGRLLLALAGGFFCVLLGWFNLIAALDNITYDSANELTPLARADDVLIVAIDERSLLEFGRWPWPRERHVQLLRQLRAAGAKAIAIDIVFAEADTEYPEVDQLLAAEIAQHGAVVLPIFVGQADRGGQLLEIQPVPAMAAAAARLGHVHIEVESDGVARSVFLREGLVAPHWEHFAVALARVLELEVDPLPGLTQAQARQQNSVVSIVRSHENLIPFMGPAGTVAMVSYVDIIKGRIPARVLQDKIVFVGATAAGHADKISTSLGQISGVEINANIFQALREGKLAQRLSREANALLSFGLTFFTIMLFTRLQPRALLIAVVLCAVLVPLAAILLLQWQRIWYSPAPVVMTVLLAYPLWNWLRLNAAVEFMHKQLQLLQTENSKSDSHWSWSHLEKAAEFLQSLGRLQRWNIGSDAGDAQQSDMGTEWLHREQQSSKWFNIDGERRLLTLVWNPDHANTDNNLELIFPETGAAASAPAFGGDYIDVDIAQLEFAYQQARHNRELISGTLAQLSSGILLADSSGSILLINHQARSLLAMQNNDSRLLEALKRLEFQGSADISAQLAALALQGIAFNREGRTLDGGRDLLCRGRLIRLDRPMFLISLTDVTDLKASERSRSEALNFLSHDLRAPLTSVLALIEGAKSENPDQLNLKLLENIEHYVQENLAYAENFTQLARLEQADAPALDECDAQSLIDNAVALVFHVAAKRGIQFRMATCDEDIWVSCNRGVLERAILNLLDNALKHSEDNSKITVTLACNENDAVIKISDRGTGIAAGEIDKIFNSFQQGARAVSGVGLGLRFVAAAVQSHRGSIDVESSVGVGSTFTLKIPRLAQHAPV